MRETNCIVMDGCMLMNESFTVMCLTKNKNKKIQTKEVPGCSYLLLFSEEERKDINGMYEILNAATNCTNNVVLHCFVVVGLLLLSCCL